MGLVKTRRLAAMQKQQRAKAGMKLPTPKLVRKCAPFPQQASQELHEARTRLHATAGICYNTRR